MFTCIMYIELSVTGDYFCLSFTVKLFTVYNLVVLYL